MTLHVPNVKTVPTKLFLMVMFMLLTASLFGASCASLDSYEEESKIENSTNTVNTTIILSDDPAIQARILENLETISWLLKTILIIICTGLLLWFLKACSGTCCKKSRTFCGDLFSGTRNRKRKQDDSIQISDSPPVHRGRRSHDRRRPNIPEPEFSDNAISALIQKMPMGPPPNYSGLTSIDNTVKQVSRGKRGVSKTTEIPLTVLEPEHSFATVRTMGNVSNEPASLGRTSRRVPSMGTISRSMTSGGIASGVSTTPSQGNVSCDSTGSSTGTASTRTVPDESTSATQWSRSGRNAK